ncbi:MAG: TIGR01777 family oxidoreductase [Vicinamibacteria bacterium]|nr:TIGR01777 family oxidoreductase [Vicinamibacteria bacterium]
MTTHEFLLRSKVQVSAARLFAWHMRRGAFERLAPPWEEPIVDSPFARPEVGGTVHLQVPVAPGVRFRWISEFKDVKDGESFRDVQQTGPFDSFDHTHRFEPVSDHESVMEDRIQYRLPFGFLGDLLGASVVRRKLAATFGYRHRALAKDLAVHARAPREALRVLVTGSTGFVGRALVSFLESGGHEVCRLTRRPAANAREIEFDPERGAAHPSEMEGFDAVIHLAGDPIAKGRWTEAKKRLIRHSRVPFTRRLSETLGALRRPPAVLVSASATGYYGDRADRILRESDPPGEGFLPEVCLQWEAATEPAKHAGIRVVHLRTGLVLSANGGALQPMLLPFRLGLGGRLGSGRQWWSFIALDDLLYLIHHVLMTGSIQGPVNATSPEPVTNADFTNELGRVLRRPAVVPVPKFALELALGAMTEPLLLASARVNPEKLLDSGFEFSYPSLDSALRHVLGRG